MGQSISLAFWDRKLKIAKWSFLNRDFRPKIHRSSVTGFEEETAMGQMIEIDPEELQREVAEFLREARDLEQKPQSRILKTIYLLRSYRDSVIRANVPRNFQLETVDKPELQHRLLRHRQEQMVNADPKSGLVPLKERLQGLDCQFILGNEPWHRVNHTDWEYGIWRPISDWVERGFALLYPADSEEIATVVPKEELLQWEEGLADLELKLLIRIADFLPEPDYPVVDDSDFSISWRGLRCELGKAQSYRLVKRLVRAKGKPVSRAEIEDALGDDLMDPAAVRQAVSRLRQALLKSDLEILAKAIISDKGHTRLDVSGLLVPQVPDAPSA